MKTLFFDTETTGLPPRNADPIRNFDKFRTSCSSLGLRPTARKTTTL